MMGNLLFLYAFSVVLVGTCFLTITAWHYAPSRWFAAIFAAMIPPELAMIIEVVAKIFS